MFADLKEKFTDLVYGFTKFIKGVSLQLKPQRNA